MTRSIRSAARLQAALVALTFAASAWAEPPDPTQPGPYAVTGDEYSQPNVTLPNFPGPVEVTGAVHHPTALGGGPFPLVVLMHGRHVTCHDGVDVALEWPCTDGRKPIESYKGYDYFARILASHGYIVVSVGANGINARDASTNDQGMAARAQLLQRHLDLWAAWNGNGPSPFGDRFRGKVDLQNVGTMGHSRGGEGVVWHYLHNASVGAPYRIRAVLPLAPVDFSRKVADGVPLAVILPYCDGDVSDLQGVHFYDDARYSKPGDPASKHTVLVLGANHNFFNTNWTPSIFAPGSSDDWWDESDPHCGTGANNGRLSPEQQQATGTAYMAAFFRLYLGGERELLPYLTGDARPPAAVGTDDIHLAFHPPDAPAQRRDLSRLLGPAELTVNTLGGAVESTGLTPHDFCGGESPQPRHCIDGAGGGQQPHTTVSHLSGKRGLSQLRTGWSGSEGSYRQALPAGSRDLSGFSVFQFRAALNFRDNRNPTGQPSDLRVILTDGRGRSAYTAVSRWSKALYYPPGRWGSVPHVLLNSVRLPLSAFTGVDLADIRTVELAFVEKPSGALLLSDLAFSAQ